MLMLRTEAHQARMRDGAGEVSARAWASLLREVLRRRQDVRSMASISLHLGMHLYTSPMYIAVTIFCPLHAKDEKVWSPNGGVQTDAAGTTRVALSYH